MKPPKNAHTYHVFAMYEMERSTAETRVVKREVKTWKSHVNATMRRVRSRFGILCLAVPPDRAAQNDSLRGDRLNSAIVRAAGK
jgi:hypothetical protein